MGRISRVALALGCLLILAVPSAMAHGAPRPRDQDTRLLADHNDDCGGDDAGSLSNCSGTHDLVALDVREAYDPSLGDVVVFRLFLNGGDAASTLEDTITLKAGGQAKTFQLRTTDNQAFQGTGFDRVSAPASIGDGTRFVVEGTVKASALGGVGAKVTDVRVEATKGSTRGDFMPGSYHTLAGNGPTSQSEQSDPQHYIRPEYALRGPSYHASVQPPGPQTVPAGGEAVAELAVRNLLKGTAQSLTFAVAGADGVQARFEGGAETLRLDLAKDGSATVPLTLSGQAAGASGTLTVTVTTDLGGRTVASIPYTVGAADPASTSATEDSDDRGASGPATAAASALALAAAAFAARRRT